jgi:hypothetical protein
VSTLRIRPLSRIYFKESHNVVLGDVTKNKISLYYSTEGDKDFKDFNLINQTTGHIYALKEDEREILA